ncbi:hypothetical protein EJB05_30893, partial [Eragrostis curvula]
MCRSSVDRYSVEAARVVSCLLRFMAADMGLEQPESLFQVFRGQPQNIKVTYYPPCAQAGKVLGLSPHTDACGLTLLLHVNGVQGLQMRTDDGKWLAILSNGRYRSVEHRVLVNPNKERIAAAMFHQVCPDTTVGPLPELVKGDAGPRFKSVSHADFMKRFVSTNLDGRRSHLDHYRI